MQGGQIGDIFSLCQSKIGANWQISMSANWHLTPIGKEIGKNFANFFANWHQMPIGAQTNLPIGANFGLA